MTVNAVVWVRLEIDVTSLLEQRCLFHGILIIIITPFSTATMRRWWEFRGTNISALEGWWHILCIIKDWDLLHLRHFVLFLQDYCALQELLMKMNFTLAVAPPFVHPMMSLPATPTHSVWKYGFLSEPTQQRQMAKYGT